MSLDMEQIANLSDHQKERYMILQRGFETDFWKIIKGWVVTNGNEELSKLVRAQKWDENRVAYGAVGAYERFANFEMMVDIEFTEYASANADAAADKAESEIVAVE